MKCRPATRADIPEMTRIITEGFLDYPLHIMLKPYLYRAEHYPECVTAINRMLADSYQRVRHALVVEHEGRVVGTALLHDRKVGFIRSFLSGGYEFFRYAPPLLVKEFSDVVDSADQVTIDKGDFDWYLEVLSVDSADAWTWCRSLAGLAGSSRLCGQARWARVWIRDLDRGERALLPQRWL